MTPLLLLFGFPAHTAVGTDLMYAALTKASGVPAHHIKKTIEWRIVFAMAAGSLPASGVTVYFLANHFTSPEHYQSLLTSTLGIMLILTSLVLLFKNQIIHWATSDSTTSDSAHSDSAASSPASAYTSTSTNSARWLRFSHNHHYMATFIMGIVLGIFVTLSSVGAGAFGTAVLLILFPKLSSIKVVGTDIAHAVPLTLAAGIGHWYLGNVDFVLLGGLLIGSLPAIYVGIYIAGKMPNNLLHPILSTALLAIGVKYTFF